MKSKSIPTNVKVLGTIIDITKAYESYSYIKRGYNDSKYWEFAGWSSLSQYKEDTEVIVKGNFAIIGDIRYKIKGEPKKERPPKQPTFEDLKIIRNGNTLILKKDGYVYEVFYKGVYLGYFHESNINNAIIKISQTGFYDGRNYDLRIQRVDNGENP